MRLLTFDASTKSAAFSYFIGSYPVRWGKIIFEGKDLYEKCTDIGKKMAAVSPLYPADLIVIEKTVFVNSPAVAQNLAATQGALIAALGATQKASIQGCGPSEWQNFIGNKAWTKDQKKKLQDTYPGKSAAWYKSKMREERKQFTIDYIKDKLGIITSDNDIADAVGIAVFALDKWGK